MIFFPRSDVTVRCAHRGLTLSVPDRDRLLNACDPSLRRRLQHRLGRASTNEPPWEVQWQKSPGDALQPEDVVVTLSRNGIVVELAYAQKGVLAEWLVTRGEQVGTGKRLAVLERRAKAAAAPKLPPRDILRQYVARQREDAETIAKLQAELAALQARLTGDAPTAGDAKFRRLKFEFSKHFHPDTRPAGDVEREQRARVFQEFWPILEEIERS